MNKKILIWIIIVVVSVITLVAVNNRKVETMSVENKDNIQYKEVCAKHILVDSEDKANEILEDIKGEKISFEDSAKKESKCPSGKDGGNLGYFKRGMMVKEFEDVAFTAKKDDVSNPVKTQFGWHLIKVTDKR